MDSNYRVAGCTSGLEWKETVIAREDGNGVATARTRTRTYARGLRDQLLSHFEKTNALFGWRCRTVASSIWINIGLAGPLQLRSMNREVQWVVCALMLVMLR